MVLNNIFQNGLIAHPRRRSSRTGERSRTPRQISSNSSFRSGILSEFLQNSTIHGFKELGRTEKSALRKFWIVVIFMCLMGVSYEIYQIINYYSGKPGATQISWNLRDHYDYPPITFCPKRWLNMEKAGKLGLNGDLLAYTVSLIQQQEVTVDADFDEDKAHEHLLRIMHGNNFTSYLDLIIAIGYEADGILRIMSSPSQISLKPMVPKFGLCYLMEVKPILANTLRTNMLLRFAYRPRNNTQPYDRRLQPHILVHDSSGVKPNFISFSKTAIYQIDFEAKVYRRISRPNKPCLTELPSNGYHVGLCELMCIQEEKARRRCDDTYNIGLMAMLNITMGPDRRPTAYCKRRPKRQSAFRKKLSNTTTAVPMIGNTECNRRSVNASTAAHLESICNEKAITEGTSACTAKCLPPCEQWVYKHSTNLLSDESGDEIIVWVAYNPIDGILWYEEVPTYTVDTFISNIGGQLGLWLGASVISVVQILYYCCLSAWRRRHALKLSKRKQSLRIESPNSRSVNTTPRENLPLV